ncbi:MAG: protein translocase subunit SecF, partial [Actinobacteria bacterium]|nr:protein translocase subunit SecF [Actinomycetota bacterium]
MSEANPARSRSRRLLHRLYVGETDVDFIGKRKLWFALSAVVILISIVSLLTRGLNYGIEFVGGVGIQAPIVKPSLQDASVGEIESELRSTLGPLGASDAQIQVAGEGADRNVLVKTREVDDPDQQSRVVEAVRTVVGAPVADTDSQRIGSEWGGEITQKALRALGIFVVVILAFISWRFEWKMAMAAIVALVHDLIITAGLYSLVGFEVTPSTVIAILTILGYSLYDTVVVFDKVDEHTSTLATSGRTTYQGAANLAMNQVFMRSLNTSLASLLPVAALLFVGAGLLGAETLKDLALALFVGILTGTYSSIFVVVILAFISWRFE